MPHIPVAQGRLMWSETDEPQSFMFFDISVSVMFMKLKVGAVGSEFVGLGAASSLLQLHMDHV